MIYGKDSKMNNNKKSQFKRSLFLFMSIISVLLNCILYLVLSDIQQDYIEFLYHSLMTGSLITYEVIPLQSVIDILSVLPYIFTYLISAIFFGVFFKKIDKITKIKFKPAITFIQLIFIIYVLTDKILYAVIYNFFYIYKGFHLRIISETYMILEVVNVVVACIVSYIITNKFLKHLSANK